MKADELTKAALREIAFRRNVYPQQIARGKMKQTEADHQLEAAAAWHNLAQLVPEIDEALANLIAIPNSGAVIEHAEEVLRRLRQIVQ